MCWCAHHFILLQSRLYKQFFSFLDFTAIVIAVKRNICCSGAEGDAKKLLKMIAEHAQHSNSEDDTQNEGKEDDDEGMDIQGTFNFDPQGADTNMWEYTVYFVSFTPVSFFVSLYLSLKEMVLCLLVHRQWCL
eukprot:m.185102 g.185102  ORF g.185102 m.185102 type:complete len:133 (+) comp13603_c0_seq6:1016-1414(+)